MCDEARSLGYEYSLVASHDHYYAVAGVRHPGGRAACGAPATLLEARVASSWEWWRLAIGWREPLALTTGLKCGLTRSPPQSSAPACR